MTVQEFVEGYEKLGADKLKNDYINKHITKKYMPYGEKVVMCKNIANITTHKKDTINGMSISYFCENSIDRKMLFTLKLIEYYTDIQIEYNINIFEQYDLLLSNKVLPIILDRIDKDEIKFLSNLLDLALDDIYTNECNITHWLDGKYNTMKNILSSMTQAFDEIKDSDELGKIIEKINLNSDENN